MPDEATAGEESTPVLRTLADKVNWLIAARRIEDVLRTVAQVDGGDMPLVVADIVSEARRSNVEVGYAVVGSGNRQRGRFLVPERLAANQLRPMSVFYLLAIANLILMH